MPDADAEHAGGTDVCLKISYQGKVFWMPDSQSPDFILKRIRATRRFYEDDLLAYLQRTARAEGQVVDCGANIGNHTLFFAGVMGRRTVAIEPIERNRTQLQRMLAANRIDNMVVVLPVAVGDRNDTVAMVTPEADNPGMYRIVDAGLPGEVVPLTRLDDLLGEPDTPIAIIKFDLEGFEESALLGGIGLVSQFRPLIIAELSTVRAFGNFFRHLSVLGYAATAVFCATPTVVFEQSASPGLVADGILARLRKFERRQSRQMVVAV